MGEDLGMPRSSSQVLRAHPLRFVKTRFHSVKGGYGGYGGYGG